MAYQATAWHWWIKIEAPENESPGLCWCSKKHRMVSLLILNLGQALWFWALWNWIRTDVSEVLKYATFWLFLLAVGTQVRAWKTSGLGMYEPPLRDIPYPSIPLKSHAMATVTTESLMSPVKISAAEWRSNDPWSSKIHQLFWIDLNIVEWYWYFDRAKIHWNHPLIVMVYLSLATKLWQCYFLHYI